MTPEASSFVLTENELGFDLMFFNDLLDLHVNSSKCSKIIIETIAWCKILFKGAK